MVTKPKFKESMAMEKKELAFMKKKGAPKAMINEHKAMAMSGKAPKKYASGGQVRGCGAAIKGKSFKGMK